MTPEITTAIYIDVENLVRGYSSETFRAPVVSLKEIFSTLRTSAYVGDSGIRRAYANWSDARLAVMKNDLIELGIEPVQVFTLGGNAGKNLADIHIAVDCIEDAIRFSDVKVFVLVTGDGSFAPLVNKLRGLGKTVIGCGFEDSKSRYLQKVCKEFLVLREPLPLEESELILPASPRNVDRESKGDLHSTTNPKLTKLLQRVKPLSDEDDVSLYIEKAREIINAIADSEEMSIDCLKGLSPSLLREAFGSRIDMKALEKFGYVRYLDFLRHVTFGTRLITVRNSMHEYLVVLRSSSKKGYVPYEIPEAINPHSEAVYRAICETKDPVIHIESINAIRRIAAILEVNYKDYPATFDSIRDVLIANLEAYYSREELEKALHSLVAVSIFSRKPIGSPIKKQELMLLSGFAKAEDITRHLIEEMHRKIARTLQSFHKEVFRSTYFLGNDETTS